MSFVPSHSQEADAHKNSPARLTAAKYVKERESTLSTEVKIVETQTEKGRRVGFMSMYKEEERKRERELQRDRESEKREREMREGKMKEKSRAQRMSGYKSRLVTASGQEVR